jgi:hypothetical protein
MLKIKSVVNPVLDAIGSFVVGFGEFGAIAHDVPSQLLTGDAAASQATILLTNTAGLAVGQKILVQDSLSSEVKTIITLTAATSIVVNSNLANAYTMARGAKVTMISGISLPLTGNAAASQATILMASTAGMVVGQEVLIQDNSAPGNFETGTIITVNANVSIILGVNLVNAYTVAAGATVTAMSPVPAKAFVAMSNFGQTAAVVGTVWTYKWAVSGTNVTVQVFKGTVVDQANIVTWAYAASADVVNCMFVVMADGE